MSVDFSQLEALRNQLESISEDMKTFIEKFLLEEAEKVLALTKDNTPYDTGLLRNSWYLGEVRRRGDSLEISIMNNVEYASYVEYGHRLKGGNGWKDGKFMCTLAIDQIERGMPASFSRALETYIRSLGRE